MGVKFIKAGEEHKTLLARVCRDADFHYSKIMPGAFEKQAIKFAQRIPDAYCINIIQENGKNIGFLAFRELNSQTVYLVSLYLSLVYQRQGYGEVILDKFMSELKISRHDEVILLVHKDAYWAINFYKKNGFIIVADTKENICKYANRLLEEFFIPSTVLMRKNLNNAET